MVYYGVVMIESGSPEYSSPEQIADSLHQMGFYVNGDGGLANVFTPALKFATLGDMIVDIGRWNELC